MSAAVSALKEEEARAYDREALLGEMMLAERDKEDRCGGGAILQQQPLFVFVLPSALDIILALQTW